MYNTIGKSGFLVTILMVWMNYATGQVLPQLSEKLIKLAPLDILPNNPVNQYLFSDRSDGKKNSITVQSQPGKTATFNVEVFSPMKNHYDTQLSWPTTKEIKKGDVLLARFSLRMIYAKRESGEGEVNFYVQQVAAPYDKLILTELGVSPGWKTYEISLRQAMT